MPGKLNTLWGPIRSFLKEEFSFADIKSIVGFAGFDLTTVAHLQQVFKGGATKDQLLSTIDHVYGKMDHEDKERFLTIVTEEMLRRRRHLTESFENYLSRLGWSFVEGYFLPVHIIDTSELPEVPANSHQDLLKAAARLRDGDLSGAISAACAAVDSVTEEIYVEKDLGDPRKAKFQEKVAKCLEAVEVLTATESDLVALGWNPSEAARLRNNLRGALNHAANVMQTLRSRMGDVHGTKPTLKPLVFDTLKWAMLIVGILKNN